MANKGQKFKRYTIEMKRKVINDKLTTGKSYKHLSDKYDIPEGTIYTWLYQYKKNEKKILNKKRGKAKREENIDYKERYEILKKFQKYLKEVEREKK